MSLASDTTLGSYKIESLLGRGGMGEVYRARDTSLDRPVAIKVLPDSFANDSDRVARFEREARLLATLSHQNIGGIYGLEESNGTRYLVLELIEGDTLKDHLSRGPLPVEETLRVCRQIADAVAAAHEQGVIHRDLKPANIMMRPDDTAKVLDFGIAKAMDLPGNSTISAGAPTISATAAGVTIGTPTYMSPEQARGKAVDRRTDIWAFGCILYECLTAKTVFGGDTVTDTFARILEREPDFSCVPKTTPPMVQTLLRRCLQKDRKKRLQDIGDARVQIDEALADPSGSTLGLSGGYQVVNQNRSVPIVPWLCTALCAAVAGVLWWQLQAVVPEPTDYAETQRLSLVVPDLDFNWDRLDYDVSPSGESLVLTARQIVADGEAKPQQQLFSRSLGQLEFTPIAGTEGAIHPRFSPNGEWLSFLLPDPPVNSTTLKRVKLDGSPALTVCTLKVAVWQQEWASDQRILCRTSGMDRGQVSVNVESGATENVRIDASQIQDYIGVETESPLPGGEHTLASGWRLDGVTSRQDALIVSLEDWSPRLVIENAQNPKYWHGRLLFVRDDTLVAALFDAAEGKVVGNITPLIAGVNRFDVTSSGHLFYHPVSSDVERRRLMTVDTQGTVAPLSSVRRPFQVFLEASEDRRVLAGMTFSPSLLPRVWRFEVSTGVMQYITEPDVVSLAPRLSHDGQRVIYLRWDRTDPAYVLASADGSTQPELLFMTNPERPWDDHVSCWAPDGKSALVVKAMAGQSDIMRLDLESGERSAILNSSAKEAMPTLSPNGILLAYSSDETGETRGYVRKYDLAAGTVSGPAVTLGEIDAESVSWSADSATLFYMSETDRLMSVDVSAEPTLIVSDPEEVVDLSGLRLAADIVVQLDADRFAFIQKGEGEKTQEYLNVVLNWLGELDRLVPVQ